MTAAYLLHAPAVAFADPPNGQVSMAQQAARLDQVTGIIVVPIQAKNVSNSFLRHVWIECPALSSSGDLVDQGVAEVGNLQPGETGFVFALMSGLQSPAYNIKCRISEISK